MLGTGEVPAQLFMMIGMDNNTSAWRRHIPDNGAEGYVQYEEHVSFIKADPSIY